MTTEPRRVPRCAFVAPANLLGIVIAALPQRMLLALGTMATWLLWPALGKRRRYAATNIALCFPELDATAQARLLRANLRATVTGLLELVRGWFASPHRLQGLAEVEGLEHLAAARAGGRGVIVVSGHFTTLEISARLMCDYAPLAGMYRPHNQGAMEWAVKRGRLRYATAMFTRDELRPALKHLKQGGLLWFAPDQDTRRGESVFVPFFGHPAYSLTSTHQLARLSGAAVIAFSHVRREDGGYTLKLSPAFEGFPSSDATADTARVIAAIEDMVRDAPTQYLWIHRRFKRQPDGRGALYR